MKKTGLIALLSASLLLVSCGGTSYVNEKVDGDNVNRDTLTLYSETFKLESYAKMSMDAILVVGPCDYETNVRYEGKLEATDTENKYKLTYETVAARAKYEGEGAYSYKQTTALVLKALGYNDEQIEDVNNNKEVKIDFESTAYVTVNPEDMTWSLL